MNIIIDYEPIKGCINTDVYFTCLKCNACGRFNKETMWQDRYDMYQERIKERVEQINSAGFKTGLQQTNILTDIAWLANKAKTCVKHIKWEEDEE